MRALIIGALTAGPADSHGASFLERGNMADKRSWSVLAVLAGVLITPEAAHSNGIPMVAPPPPPPVRVTIPNTGGFSNPGVSGVNSGINTGVLGAAPRTDVRRPPGTGGGMSLPALRSSGPPHPRRTWATVSYAQSPAPPGQILRRQWAWPALRKMAAAIP